MVATVDTQSGAFMPLSVGPEGLLDLHNITWSRTDIRCAFGDLLKTCAPNRHQDKLVFGSFPEDKSLCVVHYLRHYEKRTHALRGSEAKLFISWKAPHSGVSRDTLRRWTKMGLKTAGIDYVKVHCPFDVVSIDQQSNPEIAVGCYLEDCGLEAPKYIRYFLQEADMRRKCLLMILFVGCVN